MKRRIRILLVVCLLLSAASIFVYADVDSEDGSYNEIYDNYYLDMEEKSMLKAPVANIFNALANGIFGIMKMLGKFICSLTEFAYSVNMFELLGDTMVPLFGDIGTKIFGGLSLLLIGIAGFILVLRLAKGQLINIIIGVLSIALVIALSTAFFAYPGRILTSIDSVFSEVAGEMIDPIYEDINGSDAADVSSSRKTSDLLWNIMVHKPWQILEFGNESAAEEYEDEILALPEGSEERGEYVENANVKTFKATTAQQVERFSSVLIYLIFSLVVFAAVLLFLALIIGYQLWVWVLAIFSIFVFLMALIPNFGLGLLKRWAVQILSAMAIKVVLSFMLIILFIVMSFFYSLTGEFTLFEVMFMFLSMFFITYKKRNDLVRMFAISGHVPGTNLIRDLNRYGEPVKTGVHDVKRRVQDGATGWMVMKKYGDAPLEEKAEDMQRNNRGNDNHEAIYQNRQYEEGDPASKQRVMMRGVYSQEEKEKAIGLLRHNYNESKRISEEKARAQGKEAEYTEFVRRTDALRAMNKNAEFDTRDVEKTARIVQRYESAGGNVDDLKTKNIQEQNLRNNEVRRPKDLSTYKEREKHTANQVGTIKGKDFFKNNFGEEKGERFYDKLTEKYGEESVHNFTSNKKVTYSQVNQQLRNRDKK